MGSWPEPNKLPHLQEGQLLLWCHGVSGCITELPPCSISNSIMATQEGQGLLPRSTMSSSLRVCKVIRARPSLSVVGLGHIRPSTPPLTNPFSMTLLFCSTDVRASQTVNQGPLFSVIRETRGTHQSTPKSRSLTEKLRLPISKVVSISSIPEPSFLTHLTIKKWVFPGAQLLELTEDHVLSFQLVMGSSLSLISLARGLQASSTD